MTNNSRWFSFPRKGDTWSGVPGHVEVPTLHPEGLKKATVNPGYAPSPAEWDWWSGFRERPTPTPGQWRTALKEGLAGWEFTSHLGWDQNEVVKYIRLLKIAALPETALPDSIKEFAGIDSCGMNNFEYLMGEAYPGYAFEKFSDDWETSRRTLEEALDSYSSYRIFAQRTQLGSPYKKGYTMYYIGGVPR